MSHKAQFFSPEFNIRLYDKYSESDYFFFPPPKSEYFFQQHWELEFFFLEKKTIFFIFSQKIACDAIALGSNQVEVDYFTKRQSTLPFRGIYVVGIEAFICIYGKLLFPKQYVHPFFGEPENNLLSPEQ